MNLRITLTVLVMALVAGVPAWRVWVVWACAGRAAAARRRATIAHLDDFNVTSMECRCGRAKHVVLRVPAGIGPGPGFVRVPGDAHGTPGREGEVAV